MLKPKKKQPPSASADLLIKLIKMMRAIDELHWRAVKNFLSLVFKRRLWRNTSHSITSKRHHYDHK